MEQIERTSKRQKIAHNPNDNNLQIPGNLGVRSVILAESNEPLSPLANLFALDFMWKTIFDFACQKVYYRTTGSKRAIIYVATTDDKTYDLLYNLRLVCKTFREASHLYLPLFFSVYMLASLLTQSPANEDEAEGISPSEEEETPDFLTTLKKGSLPLGFPPLLSLKLFIRSEEELKSFLEIIDKHTTEDSSATIKEITVQCDTPNFPWKITKLFPSTITDFYPHNSPNISKEDIVDLRHCTKLKSIQLGVCKGQLFFPPSLEELTGGDIDGFILDLNNTHLKTIDVGKILNGGNCILPNSATDFSCEDIGSGVILDFRNNSNLKAILLGECKGEYLLPPYLETFRRNDVNNASLDLRTYSTIKTVFLSNICHGNHHLPTSITELEVTLGEINEEFKFDLSTYPNLQKFMVYGHLDGAIKLSPSLISFGGEVIFNNAVNFAQCPRLLSIIVQSLIGDYSFPPNLESFQCTNRANGTFNFFQCTNLKTIQLGRAEGDFQFPASLASFSCKSIGVKTDIDLRHCTQLTALNIGEISYDAKEYQFIGKLRLSSQHHQALAASLPNSVQSQVHWDDDNSVSYISEE